MTQSCCLQTMTLNDQHIEDRRSVTSMKDSNRLPLSKYQKWFDVIITNDVEKAESMLGKLTEVEKHHWINQPFEYDRCKDISSQEKSPQRITLPFHLAVCYGSKAVAQLLVENCENPLAVNERKDNVLHSCVVAALNRTGLEHSVCDMIDWLQRSLTPDQWKELLFQENKEGLYPVEFAAHQGCLLTFHKLLSTEGHVSFEETCGLQLYRLHDITEYEIGDRHDKSPLHFLAFLDKKVLSNKEYLKIILDPLITGWIDAKIKSNLILVVIWIFLRLVVTVPYYVVDSSTLWLSDLYGNNSGKYMCRDINQFQLGQNRNYFIGITMVLAGISILRFIAESLKSTCTKTVKRSYDLNGPKKVLTNTRFYLRVNALYLLLLLTLNALYIIVIVNKVNLGSYLLTIIAVFRSIIPVLFLWSVAYFLQLIPAVATSIMSMQSMLGDVGKFFLIYTIIALPFIHVFQAFFLANSVDGCLQQFSTPYNTAYTLFMVMMNMVDMTQFNMTNSGVLYFVHVIYAFMVGIMLLNFLIALMSSTASSFAEHKAVALKLNQLALVVALEDRAYRLCKGLYRKFRKLGFMCQEGKVYILSVGNRLENLPKNGNFSF